jgi:hypothetical protein
MSADHARHVPVRRVTHGDSRSFTEQPLRRLTYAAAGPVLASTSFASRGSEAESWTLIGKMARSSHLRDGPVRPLPG